MPKIKLKYRLLLIGLAILFLPASLFPASEISSETLLHCSKLWDGRSDALQSDVTIVIDGQRIKNIMAGKYAPNGASILNVDGTCMPGLIDVHTHVFLQEDSISPTYDEQLLKESVAFRTIRAVRSAALALQHGFTTIRDLETEGASYADVDLRNAIAAGIIPGPTMQVAGRALDVTGAYPLEGYAAELQPLLPHGVQVVDGVESARKAVREQISYGIDWVKVYADRSAYVQDDVVHGIPTFTVDELRAIVDEAHREKHRVACHAMSVEGVENALLGGVDSIEHGASITDHQMAEMKERGIYYVPTLYDLQYSAERRHSAAIGNLFRIGGKTLSRAMQAGVKIAFGTDVGGFDWQISAAKQMQTFVSLGMTAQQAILSSTRTGAELMGISSDTGVLEPGKFADIIAVTGDPLTDVSSLEHVQLTMKHGELYKHND